MKIKKRTIRRLRTAASKFFPDDDAYHVWLAGEFGYESTLELSEDEAQRAITIIDRKKREQKKAEHGQRSSKWLSFEQKDYINGLFKELKIPEGNRRVGFIKKQIGQPKVVDWLTNREASKVITGLKRFRESQYSESNK